ncbi:LLM class flavin-dependent oxidoreductase [Streptomyces sp. NPDC056512]|uniref:LLM class flavin-dependent oxidoreductase n=1 Tax=Streptomyces sp. NPDC056512 TaxID=3345846 RepID=UPI003686F7BB
MGTHVLIAPLYPPVRSARSMTTIDLVSGGRLCPGFGIGWSPEEYQAAGLDFGRRGARMDELLDALEALWTEGPAQHNGVRLPAPLHHSPLKPAGKPCPPFCLGALSERGLATVVPRGDGWLPLCVVPSFVGIDGLIAQRSPLDRLAREVGRAPEESDTVLRVNIDAGTGVTQVADTIRLVHERTGIDHCMVDPMHAVKTVDETIDHARDVLGLIAEG